MIIEQSTQDMVSIIHNTGSISTDIDTNHDDHDDSETRTLFCNRKRDIDLETSYTALIRPSKHVMRLVEQRKLSTAGGRRFMNGTSDLKPCHRYSIVISLLVTAVTKTTATTVRLIAAMMAARIALIISKASGPC
jgi:hypothetical protein